MVGFYFDIQTTGLCVPMGVFALRRSFLGDLTIFQ